MSKIKYKITLVTLVLATFLVSLVPSAMAAGLSFTFESGLEGWYDASGGSNSITTVDGQLKLIDVDSDRARAFYNVTESDFLPTYVSYTFRSDDVTRAQFFGMANNLTIRPIHDLHNHDELFENIPGSGCNIASQDDTNYTIEYYIDYDDESYDIHIDGSYACSRDFSSPHNYEGGVAQVQLETDNTQSGFNNYFDDIILGFIPEPGTPAMCVQFSTYTEWEHCEEVRNEDGVVAEGDGTNDHTTSDHQLWQDFDTTLPEDAIIDLVELITVYKAAGSTSGNVLLQTSIDDGVTRSSNHFLALSGSMQTVVTDITSDWTYEYDDFEDGNFAVKGRCQATTGTPVDCEVDLLKVNVSYHLPEEEIGSPSRCSQYSTFTEWENCENAYVEDGNVSEGDGTNVHTTSDHQLWQDFGLDIPNIAVIQKVRLIATYKAAGGTDGKILFKTSVDDGVTLGDNHEFDLSGTMQTVTVDVTADRTWTLEDFEDGNFAVKGRCLANTGTDVDCELDHVSVKVTYTELSPYCVVESSVCYKTFNEAQTAASGGNTIMITDPIVIESSATEISKALEVTSNSTTRPTLDHALDVTENGVTISKIAFGESASVDFDAS